MSFGTTKFYTLSIYVESSVLLAPDVQTAIYNYLRLCWKQRHSDQGDFKKNYIGILQQKPPLKDEQIREWLGNEEEYGVHVPSFKSLSRDYDRKWTRYVEKNYKNFDDFKRQLLKHKVKNVFLKDTEIAAALRYLNYAYHSRKFETEGFDLDDMEAGTLE